MKRAAGAGGKWEAVMAAVWRLSRGGGSAAGTSTNQGQAPAHRLVGGILLDLTFLLAVPA